MKKVILKEISIIKSGKTPDTAIKSFYENGDFLFYGAGDVKNKVETTRSMLTLSAIEQCKMSLSNEKTIFVGIYASTFGAFIPPIKSTSNQAVLHVNVDDKSIDPKYFEIWFNSRLDFISLLANGAAQQNLNKNIVESLVVTLPTTFEQKKILSIIWYIYQISFLFQLQLSFFSLKVLALQF